MRFRVYRVYGVGLKGFGGVIRFRVSRAYGVGFNYRVQGL